jgi:hypothetical protein
VGVDFEPGPMNDNKAISEAQSMMESPLNTIEDLAVSGAEPPQRNELLPPGSSVLGINWAIASSRIQLPYLYQKYMDRKVKVMDVSEVSTLTIEHGLFQMLM